MHTQEFFFVTPTNFTPGTIVEPGNWGRMVNQYVYQTQAEPGFGNAWTLAREIAFEHVRALEFPHLPSRLNANFLFLSLDDARQQQRNIGESVMAKRIYRATLLEPDAPSHVGDFEVLNIPPTPVLPWAIQAARRYWEGSETARVREFLTISPMKLTTLIHGDPYMHQPLPQMRPSVL